MDPLIILFIILLLFYGGGIGFYGPMAAGGLIHLLFVIAIVVLLVRVLRGERL